MQQTPSTFAQSEEQMEEAITKSILPSFNNILNCRVDILNLRLHLIPLLPNVKQTISAEIRSANRFASMLSG